MKFEFWRKFQKSGREREKRTGEKDSQQNKWLWTYWNHMSE